MLKSNFECKCSILEKNCLVYVNIYLVYFNISKITYLKDIKQFL